MWFQRSVCEDTILDDGPNIFLPVSIVIRILSYKGDFSQDSNYRFLVNDQRDAQIPFYVFIFIFNSQHVSSTSCSSSGETNCIYTTSGNCHSMLVAVLCASWEFIPNLQTTRPPT